ncbi:MAG: ABC transporter ATP-binding protein [Aquabacterium sp.]|nr:ABC transporter ATP-binding protein [Aquabacterium sp.]
MAALQAAPAAIELIDAGLTYADGTQALQPLDLRVPAGQFISLLGPSGCGKSTLLKLMSRLLTPTQGRIQRTDSRLSYVFQDATLMPWASVADNVRLPLDLAHSPKAVAAERVQQTLATVGLTDFAQHKPHQLSGGMQMRASIARALVTQPDVLLMDEPFGALDEITRHQLDDELRALWQRQPGLTVVFVTHSIAEAVFLSQRVIVMGARPGRIVADRAIDTPLPRDEAFRTSPQFNAQVRELLQLMQAG